MMTTRGAKIQTQEARLAILFGCEEYLVFVAQASCQFQGDPPPETRISVCDRGKLECGNSRHHRIGESCDRGGPVCLGINDGHFADVLAGTSPSDDSSIDDNRERSAQY